MARESAGYRGKSIGGCMERNDDDVDRTMDVCDPAAQLAIRTWLTADEVIAELGSAGRHTTAAAIHQRQRRGRLLGARVDGHWRYAPFQFRQGRVCEDVEALLRLLTPRWAADVATWFVLPSADLDGRTPQEVLLAHGLTPALRESARRFGASGWLTRDLP